MTGFTAANELKHRQARLLRGDMNILPAGLLAWMVYKDEAG